MLAHLLLQAVKSEKWRIGAAVVIQGHKLTNVETGVQIDAKPTLRRTVSPPPKAEGSRQRGAVGSSGAGAAVISWSAPWVIASPSVWKRKTGSRTDFAINTLAPYVRTALINKPKISARAWTTGLAQSPEDVL
jgi:hypothetical protein